MATSIPIYKDLTSTGELEDVKGMVQVSSIFGFFYSPLLAPFLPALYPEAFA